MKIKQYNAALNAERKDIILDKSTFRAEIERWFTVDEIINEFLNQRRGEPINTDGTDIAWHFNEDDKRRLRNLR